MRRSRGSNLNYLSLHRWLITAKCARRSWCIARISMTSWVTNCAFFSLSSRAVSPFCPLPPRSLTLLLCFSHAARGHNGSRERVLETRAWDFERRLETRARFTSSRLKIAHWSSKSRKRWQANIRGKNSRVSLRRYIILKKLKNKLCK